MYKFFIIFILLLVFVNVAGVHPTVCWLALPAIIFMQFLFICALSGLVSTIVPLIPDLKHAVHYGMTMLFFMSGIFFDISELGEPVRSWLSWNPALIFIASYREVLLNQLWPDWFLLMRVMLITFVVLLVVSILFRSLDRYYPRVVN
jgi:lipopolysaccharide transport system permease protein